MSDSVSLSTTPTLSSDFDFRDATCVFSMSRTDSFSHAGEDELELDSSKQNITSESTERVFTHKLRVFEENGNETICKRVSFSSENATEKLENFTVGSYDFADTSSGRDLVLEEAENSEHGERNGQELPAPEEDPSVRSVKYLEKYHILRLFQNLAADIVYNRPENPLQHIVDKLERSRDNQASKEQDRSPGLSSELLF